MVRSPRCDNRGLKKGPWTSEEDRKLLDYIQEHGHGSWRFLPSKAGLQRCGRSCRLRWTNYLRPDIKRGKFSLEEEQTIIQLHALLGNRWSAIATHLPKRTDNEIRKYWNSHLKKRLAKLGSDPMTHKPKNPALNCGQSKVIANISHMAQWESARLQAEARLVREAKLVISNPYHSQLLNTAAAPPPPPALPSRPPCLDILKVWEWTNPGQDISSLILNGFPGPSDGENMHPITTDGYGDSSIGNLGPSTVRKSNNSYDQNEAKGIMENSEELHDHHIRSTYIDDSPGFPSFIDGFTDLPPSVVSATGPPAPGGCWGVLEENKSNSWSNILDVLTSPMDTSTF